MIAFDVSLNGSSVCRAGVGELGVMTAMITWVTRSGQNTGAKEPENVDEELTLDISGLINGTNEHVRWVQSKLTLGDEILIRIKSLDSVDVPWQRRTEDPTDDLKRQQKYVEQMAKRFGWTIQKLGKDRSEARPFLLSRSVSKRPSRSSP